MTIVTSSNYPLIDIWCNISRSVNRVSDQDLNVSRDLLCVNFIFDINHKSEYVAKFRFASVLKNLQQNSTVTEH